MIGTTRKWPASWAGICMGLLWYAATASGANTTIAPDKLAPLTIPASLVTVMSDYRSAWIRLTNLEYSGLHWNQNIVIYINQGDDIYQNNYRLYRKMFEEEDEEEGDQPSEQNNAVFRSYTTGTIIVKENHLALEQAFPKPSSVTVMMKQPPGYDPNMGDWQFIQFDAYGNVLIDGNSQNPSVKLQCAFCHASMAERDYVFSTTVPLYKTKLRTFDMVE